MEVWDTRELENIIPYASHKIIGEPCYEEATMTKTREHRVMAIAANASLNIVKVNKYYSKVNLVNQLLEGLVIENLIYSHKNLLLISFRDSPGLCFFDYKKDLLLKAIVPAISNPLTAVAMASLIFTAPQVTRAT